MRLLIDHIPVEVSEGTTVMEAAAFAGVVIPSMCFLPGYKNNSSCMICMVKDDSTGKFFPSCAMPVAEGMKIITQSEEVREIRKQALELLLSDHVGDCEAPCRLTCPAFMDIPLMNRLIASGDFNEALKIVREEIALPLILGYICPAPCEKACHRGSIDQPVLICLLKRSTAIYHDNTTPPLQMKRGQGGEAIWPDIKRSTAIYHDNTIPPLQMERGQGGEAPQSGKKVAIIGTGPAGLSAAFYLLRSGHECVLFDKNEKPGGSLRYVIPDEQLPKEALDEEIKLIQEMGAVFQMSTTISKEIFENQIIRNFDAVILATGNRKEQPVEIFFEKEKNQDEWFDLKKLTTSRPGLFVCGNMVREQQMAVRSVAQGKMAANQVDLYFGMKNSFRKHIKFNSMIGKLQETESNEYLLESIPDTRIEPSGGFLSGFTEEEAIHEAKRCLHCDCRKPASCKLRLYAEEYSANRKRFAGNERKKLVKSLQHDLVIFESEKCIKCGLCIEISKKEESALGLTFIGRGFDVKVSVPFSQTVKEGLQNSAIECVNACPTGALSLKTREERRGL